VVFTDKVNDAARQVAARKWKPLLRLAVEPGPRKTRRCFDAIHFENHGIDFGPIDDAGAFGDPGQHAWTMP
jgi:hypothetical protein